MQQEVRGTEDLDAVDLGRVSPLMAMTALECASRMARSGLSSRPMVAGSVVFSVTWTHTLVSPLAATKSTSPVRGFPIATS